MPPLAVEEGCAPDAPWEPPEPLLEERFVEHINDLARRHPLLLDAVGRYLAQRQWRFRDEEWSDILAGRHAAEVTRETISRLLHTVEDHRSRELLYRLTLVIGAFSEEDAVALASVAPVLGRPRERLHEVIGPWIQLGGRSQLLLSPLVDTVGSDDLPGRSVQVPSAAWFAGHPTGSDRSRGIVRRRHVFCEGAGIRTRRPPPDPGACPPELHGGTGRPEERLSLWFGVPLPEKMNLGLRLYLRALQYRVRTRYGRSVDKLLDDIDRLSRLAQEPEGWAVLGAAVLLGRHLGEVDRLLGIRLLRRAFQLTTEFRTFADREFVWPDGWGPNG